MPLWSTVTEAWMRAVRIIAEVWKHSMVGRTRLKLIRNPSLIHFWGPHSDCYQENNGKR